MRIQAPAATQEDTKLFVEKDRIDRLGRTGSFTAVSP